MGRFEEARAKELIEPDGSKPIRKAMRYLAEQLANFGRIDEAYETAKLGEASLELVDATIRSGDPERALRYVRSLPNSSEKAEGLAKTASALAERGDRTRALAILSEILDTPEQNVPAPPPGADYSQVSWRVKSKETGKYTIQATHSNIGTAKVDVTIGEKSLFSKD